jgi:hypothetical protein
MSVCPSVPRRLCGDFAAARGARSCRQCLRPVYPSAPQAAHGIVEHLHEAVQANLEQLCDHGRDRGFSSLHLVFGRLYTLLSCRGGYREADAMVGRGCMGWCGELRRVRQTDIIRTGVGSCACPSPPFSPSLLLAMEAVGSRDARGRFRCCRCLGCARGHRRKQRAGLCLVRRARARPHARLSVPGFARMPVQT